MQCNWCKQEMDSSNNSGIYCVNHPQSIIYIPPKTFSDRSHDVWVIATEDEEIWIHRYINLVKYHIISENSDSDLTFQHEINCTELLSKSIIDIITTIKTLTLFS